MAFDTVGAIANNGVRLYWPAVRTVVLSATDCKLRCIGIPDSLTLKPGRFVYETSWKSANSRGGNLPFFIFLGVAMRLVPF